ncbi:iron chelate uptake ABC transporter family permease subunit [Labilibaculum sp. 44]|uniref:Iron chelate uptake ABC transporter family permease subunit n=1 Tax=Labilibaculum euxinus TaxID=2686357 RepID=A0A7M4DAJ4_9BACT|nr:iron chelate uptake ABC transporter family permease subunit [Labilibaculum euxinus]MVB08878.1 iron chelate uptake ABC transporter family permease subunit [Labilibaculum euxinus]
MELFQYNFFLNAVGAAILASISCGIIGSYIVARRIVFISGGITHASFGGIGLAWYLGLNPVFGAAVFGVLSALGIEWISKKTDVRQDSVIGILWAFGMALGILFIYMTPGYAPNLMSFLFGNILTVGALDLYLLLGLCVFTIAVFFFLLRPILFVAFDEEFARTQKAPVQFLNYLLISLVALAIVLNIRVVGIILVISFLTIPQTIANMFTNDFKKMIFGSIAFGILGSFIGLLVSYRINAPSGATIIFSFVILFVIAKLVQLVMISVRRKNLA